MDRAQVGYRRVDNCFTHVDDLPKAQALLDRQVGFDYAKALGQLAARTVNPAHRSIVGSYDVPYYWSQDEREWADDVMFRSPAPLQALYPSLTRQAIGSFGAPSVMRFLGRSVPSSSGNVHGNFEGEVLSEYKHHPEGVCVKHRVNRNSIKMYDKAGSVLRVETTLNNMRDFKGSVESMEKPCQVNKKRRDISEDTKHNSTSCLVSRATRSKIEFENVN